MASGRSTARRPCGSRHGEFIGGYAEPFTLVVIADLEGVPESDHGTFKEHLSALPGQLADKPLEFLYDQFTAYIEDRRRSPHEDIMTAMATATFPDGSLPEVKDVALLAANLFAGGQETTVRLLSFALRLIAERPDIQQRLRQDRDRIPNFIEETLRYESPLRSQFPHGPHQGDGGRGRDPGRQHVDAAPRRGQPRSRTFPNPDEFDIDRSNARMHVAFGHGIHHCAGAHLARAEGRVTINRILDRTGDIGISEAAHGPAGDRHYDFLPTYFLRGLESLTLELTPP